MDKYQHIYEKTGKKPSALANLPEIRPDMVIYWSGFINLDKSREYGVTGPLGIRYAEIAAYAGIQQFSDEDTVDFAYLIGKLDTVFLNWKADNGGT